MNTKRQTKKEKALIIARALYNSDGIQPTDGRVEELAKRRAVDLDELLPHAAAVIRANEAARQ